MFLSGMSCLYLTRVESLKVFEDKQIYEMVHLVLILFDELGLSFNSRNLIIFHFFSPVGFVYITGSEKCIYFKIYKLCPLPRIPLKSALGSLLNA